MIIGNGEISLGIVKPGLGHLYPGIRVQSGLSSSVKREKNELYEEILGKLFEKNIQDIYTLRRVRGGSCMGTGHKKVLGLRGGTEVINVEFVTQISRNWEHSCRELLQLFQPSLAVVSGG